MCTFAVVYQKGRARARTSRSTATRSTSASSSRCGSGRADALTTTTLFKGQIVSLELDFGAGGVELLVPRLSTAPTC